MLVFCRKAGGKDPLGDVIFVNTVGSDLTEEAAILKTWGPADTFNRHEKKPKNKIAFIHCGDTLLDVKTGKLRSLTGKIKGALWRKRQPDLDMPNKNEPRLL